MSFAGPRYLLNPSVKDDCSIFLVKNFVVSLFTQENILQKLVLVSSFEEISKWVENKSNGQRYIANPSGASDIDRLVCLFNIQEPIAKALLGKNSRKNGRELKLIKAADTANYAVIADIIASTAWTYWQDHGFFSERNLKNELTKLFQIKSNEQNEEKQEFQKAQIETIGASVCFEKALKKGAFQSSLDFEETEEILKNIDIED